MPRQEGRRLYRGLDLSGGIVRCEGDAVGGDGLQLDGREVGRGGVGAGPAAGEAVAVDLCTGRRGSCRG